MIEYPAMIYKNGRSKVYVANCMVKNLVGFGKTEEAAVDNLKESLKSVCELHEISIKPMYGLSLAK